MRLETGTWTPIPYGARPDGSGGYIGTFNGHYMRINDMVTVIFHIEYSASVADDDRSFFYIDNSCLPYPPDPNMNLYSGSGYVNGLYTNEVAYANPVFSGWTIDVYNDKIYARVLGKSTVDNQTHYDGGYMYVKNNVMTYLSGTITYKIADE